MNDPNRYEPTEEDLRGAPVLPGFELPDSVTLGRGVVHAQGLQPEDIGVLGYLKLRDPRQPATKEDLAREIQSLGWKMGKTRFDGIFQRLKSTGHIKHASKFNPKTGRPEWRIEFFLNPSNNDQYVNSGIDAFPQVGAETPETGDTQIESLFETLETSVSSGQKESQVSRDSEGKPWKPAFPSEGVVAGQGRNAENPVFGTPPPHPPEEEVGTTSPSPHKPATTSRRDKQQQQPDVAPEAAAAAREFLMKLPGPWAAGAQRAANLAPWLVQNANLTGWNLDIALRMYLTRKESGKKPVENYGAMLAYRVKEMQSREAVMQAALDAETAKDQPAAPAVDAKPGLPDWCGRCNNGEKPLLAYMRVIPSPNPADDSVTRCKDCHPGEVRTRTNT